MTNLSLSLSLSLSQIRTFFKKKVLTLVVLVNGIGNVDNVEVAEEETSDKHIERHVRVLISSYSAGPSSHWLNEMPWQFILCRPPPQGCRWCSLRKSTAQRYDDSSS
jgi:hypothetical protein